MAYVPSAVRKKQLQEVEQKVSADMSDGKHGYSLADADADAIAPPMATEPVRQRLPHHFEIHDYYWPECKQLDENQRLSSLKESIHQGTLNASAEAPGQLKYILLFNDANPRWKSDGIIFVKSSLHILPGSEKFGPEAKEKKKHGLGDSAAPAADEQAISNAADTTESTTPTAQETIHESSYTPDLSLFHWGTIAVFEQKGGRKGGFEFAGYHKITRLQFLEPYNDELQRMLMQNFSKVNAHGKIVQQQRSHHAWDASMSHRWAVMKLEKDEETDIPDPKIKVRELKAHVGKPRESKKRVNELLAEMRIKDGAVTAEDGVVEGTPDEKTTE